MGDVVRILDEFSAEHRLSFGLGASRGAILESAVRRKGTEDATAARRGLNLLVLRAGLGGATLRCIPVLIETSKATTVYEVVSVEEITTCPMALDVLLLMLLIAM